MYNINYTIDNSLLSIVTTFTLLGFYLYVHRHSECWTGCGSRCGSLLLNHGSCLSCCLCSLCSFNCQDSRCGHHSQWRDHCGDCKSGQYHLCPNCTTSTSATGIQRCTVQLTRSQEAPPSYTAVLPSQPTLARIHRYIECWLGLDALCCNFCLLFYFIMLASHVLL